MDYVNPPVTVSAMILCDDKVLVGKRKISDAAHGKFDLPGGFLEAGETLEYAVRREVREETGLELSSLSYYSSVASKYIDGRDILCVHFVATKYREPQETDELHEFEWVHEVPDMASESDAAAMRSLFSFLMAPMQ